MAVIQPTPWQKSFSFFVVCSGGILIAPALIAIIFTFITPNIGLMAMGIWIASAMYSFVVWIISSIFSLIRRRSYNTDFSFVRTVGLAGIVCLSPIWILYLYFATTAILTSLGVL